MTKTICEEKQKQIDSIFNSIEMGTQFRLRQELENLEDNAKVILAGLEYESTEQIGEYADRLTGETIFPYRAPASSVYKFNT